MPLRGSSKASKFDGIAIDLVQFLEDIEMLCEDVEIDTPDDKIKWACHYASHDEAELWVTLPAQQGNDWNAFYPGAEDDNHKYTCINLNGLVTAQAAVPMASHGMLSEYIRNFTHIASFLKKRKKISQGEQEVKFLNGFHPTFKTQLLNRLTLVFLDHYLDKPWPMKDIIAHTMFLLSHKPPACHHQP
ncbi:hypothetical protein ID866_13137 [Astraeus odoratus]|nr:hypothetical protein ID866_13137 [Astraeus odoratus]